MGSRTPGEQAFIQMKIDKKWKKSYSSDYNYYFKAEKHGYIGMLELHLSFNPPRYEPPYTRPVRTVV
jgi:hypothetical protein